MTDFIKHDGFHCSGDKGVKKYSTLLAAQNECTVRHECGMIYDDSCDADNYWVCPSTATIKTSTEGSCLYVKGTHLIQFVC